MFRGVPNKGEIFDNIVNKIIKRFYDITTENHPVRITSEEAVVIVFFFFIFHYLRLTISIIR